MTLESRGYEVIMSVSIDINKVVKKYGDTVVVNGLSVDIMPGEFFTLLGPSGCGKTTLLRMIIGFNSIEGGTISVDGNVINDVATDKRNMGMVFQNYAIFPHMSVKDNVAFGLRMRKVPEKEIEERVDKILKIVKIDHLKDRMPTALSGGQQQRVALARAIVIRPQVLLMDEPLSNLDAKLRIEMRNAIKQIQRRVDITTVYVTHDQAEAMSLSDKIIIMNKGHIEQVGTPHEVYQHPASRFVADFIGSANFVEAKVSEGDSEGEMIPVRMLNEDFNVHYAGLPVKAGDTVQIVLRPESIRLADSGDVEAEVISSTYMGAVQEYVVRAGDKELETEEYNPEGKRIYRPGDKVWLRIQRDALHAVEN